MLAGQGPTALALRRDLLLQPLAALALLAQGLLQLLKARDLLLQPLAALALLAQGLLQLLDLCSLSWRGCTCANPAAALHGGAVEPIRREGFESVGLPELLDEMLGSCKVALLNAALEIGNKLSRLEVLGEQRHNRLDLLLRERWLPHLRRVLRCLTAH